MHKPENIIRKLEMGLNGRVNIADTVDYKQIQIPNALNWTVMASYAPDFKINSRKNGHEAV